MSATEAVSCDLVERETELAQQSLRIARVALAWPCWWWFGHTWVALVLSDLADTGVHTQTCCPEEKQELIGDDHDDRLFPDAPSFPLIQLPFTAYSMLNPSNV